uniref:Melan-A n=1 Tax=Xiphophorus maculatus TaxID=8083 RepID=M3ZSI7_XIPMA
MFPPPRERMTPDLKSIITSRAVGIGLLVVVLAGLFILGCWYLKKRSGYKILRVPNAPPAYEKISSGPLPPPYSP